MLVVAVLAVYNPVSKHPFVNYDDDVYVTHNLHVRNGLSWDTVTWAFTTSAEANWHPLTWISHATDAQLFRLNPSGHHYVNLLFHAVNVVLLFLLLQRATGFAGRSLMVAALFALHPINVESVAWVAERKNVLSMFFLLLALEAYRQYVRKPGVGRYCLVALCFACGLMAKPMIITLPFVLLLWDYWPLERTALEGESKKLSSLVVEKIPLFALSAASAWVTMYAQSVGGAVRSVVEYPFSVRLGNALVAYARYVMLAFWPAKLGPMYPHPADSLPGWQVGVSGLFLLAATVLVIVFRKHRYLLVGWFWFLGTLVPMIGLVQVGKQAMADRYAYLPFLGLFIMACWAVGEWAQQKHISALRLAIPVLIVLAALAAATFRQLNYWSDNVTLWSHTVAITGPNAVAQDNLGGALVEENRIAEAMPHFQVAAEIDPSDPVSHLNLASYQLEQGNPQEAVKQLDTVLNLTSEPRLKATVLSNLGAAYSRMRDYPHAKKSFEEALALDPQRVQAITGLGLLAQRSGDLHEAIEQYSRAVSLEPSGLRYALLAQALEKSGRAAEAQAAYQEAARLFPDLDQLRQSVDALLSR